MTTILQLLKSRTVIFALLAVLSIVQCYVALLPITPVQQMIVGCVIAVATAMTGWAAWGVIELLQFANLTMPRYKLITKGITK
jgi:hypothetical protein